jgi:ferredoxin-NADP reductase
MYWILMVFPSGEEVRVSVRTLRPADGATSSLSIESKKAAWRASAASAAGEFSCASSSSRLETLGFSTGVGMPANTF